MTKLKSLTLSNVRRFSENTKIEFGESATIIIAPNGTGKTSIFEAIEFILTGKVSRLTTLETLVRDKQDQATIGIQFSCNASKTAKINSYGETEFIGDLTSVLSQTASEDLPYLLRLTHMLDQRGSHWFVQSDTAGTQLNKLPIGRDAASANKLVNSVKRAANLHQKDASRDLDEAQKKLTDFQGLVNKKTEIEKNSKQPLVAIQSLIKSLNNIAITLNHDSRVSAEKLSEIKDVMIQLVSKTEMKYQEESKKKNNLVEIKPIVENYLDSFSKLKLASNKNSELQKKVLADRASLQAKQLEEANINTSYNTMLNELNSLKVTMEKIEQYDKLNDEISLIKQRIFLVGSQIDEAENKDELTKLKHKEQLELQSKHILINKSFEALVNEEASVDRAKEHLLTLVQLNNEENEFKKALIISETNVSVCSDNVNLITKEKNIVKSKLEKEELHLSHLTKASDSIRSAVTIIASELPKNQDDCPVCGESHGFTELHRRISVELAKIDPSITLIADSVQELRIKLKNKERLVMEAKEELSKVVSINVRSKDLVINIRAKITEIIENIVLPERFNNSLLKIKNYAQENNIQASKNDLEAVLINITTERNNLTSQKNYLKPISISDIENVEEDLRSSEFKVRGLKSSGEEAKRTYEQKKNELEKYVIADIDRLNVKAISNKERKLNESKLLSPPIKEELERIRLTIERTLRDKQQNQFEIDEYSSVVNKTKVTWASLGLLNEPDLASLIVFIDNVNEKLINLVRCKNELNNIQTEISRWTENKQFTDLQETINSIKGEASETIFLESLILETQQQSIKIDEINKKLDTLQLFSKKLAGELKNIDGRVQEIEPMWRSLLSRIVLDPRYSKTGLDITTKYNKPVATISAPLHNGVTSVNMLASEAQITDLQLTFLMAMAQKQNWSPWRGLLLDDPTQHHDLVHSSSVFDLLRDFIVEDGFQLVLTTHDKVQANFLRRKLENDGVPVTICQLQATEHGVIANELVL